MIKKTYMFVALLAAFIYLGLIGGCATTKVYYASPSPHKKLVFPRDHGAHNDFQTEWWYFNGHLDLTDGTSTGFELVFFRRRTEKDHIWGIPVRWIAGNPLYLSHFAITDPSLKRFVYSEDKGNFPYAGAKASRMLVWCGTWVANMFGDGTILLSSSMKDYGINLVLTPERPPVLNGDKNGISRKGENGGSGYYYSYTRMSVKGFLRRDKKYIKVKKGLAWMDHEFFSMDLAKNLVGWDWFSMQLNNGSDIMAFILHRPDGKIDPYSSGTLVRPDGSIYRFTRDAFSVKELAYWKSPRSDGKYPVKWRITLPSENIDLELSAVMPNQELITKYTHINYWEGEMAVYGKYNGKDAKGKGYVEITGRDRPIYKSM